MWQAAPALNSDVSFILRPDIKKKSSHMNFLRSENQEPLRESLKPAASQKPGDKSRRWAKLILKSAISILALWLIIGRVDIQKTFDILASSDKVLWTIALALLILSQIISTYRWKILLAPMGFPMPWFRVFKIYFVGMFFSLFLPTVVGGDGIKTYYIARDWKQVPAALFTVLADRTIGLAAMQVLMLTGLFFTWHYFPIWLNQGLVGFALVLYLAILFLPRISAPGLWFLRKVREIPSERLFIYWQSPGPAVRAWAVSILIHLCLVIAHLLLGRSLGLDITGKAWFVIYPFSAMAAFLPISLNGLGVREAAYIYMMAFFGVPSEIALSLGFMWFSIVIANGILGGLPYVLGGSLKESGSHGY